ncbi:MAG: UDP-N-acetylmuramoylalanine--D-glutamate ligase [Elusimicrobia bacterium]|nr:UDP-N-acetylmuramoylalanine--D-glutamate ligase [Elusimicrobiota bacterium]
MKKQQVVVVGAAKSGIAAAQLLLRHGAKVTLVDEKPLAQIKPVPKNLGRFFKFKAGVRKFFNSRLDLIVVSPGVPWNHSELNRARKRGISVWPELELGWRLSCPKITIAVTGTNGKTTTTALIGHILRQAGFPTVVGGNIGTPLSALVNKITPSTYLVLEVSSYQLEGHRTFHPNIAVFLNLTPDHLKRHGTMSRYAAAKGKLFQLMRGPDVAVLNKSDRWCRELAKSIRAQKRFFPNPSDRRLAKNLKLPGRHNLENAMAAVGACRALGISDSIIQSGLSSFRGVPHRIEFVRELKGVRYFNDSKATNVDSTKVALNSFKEKIVLILGGEHKGSSYRPLIPLIKKNVRAIITIGEAAPLIEKELRRVVPLYSSGNINSAVRLSQGLALKGMVVLLSPACASFDQFRNYEHRGDVFIRCVRQLR